MTLTVLAALALTGLAAGFLSGLVGIGGGVLIVPFLYFFYAHPAWSGAVAAPELHVTLAHATSLFIIVPTAIVGTVNYSRTGTVAWPVALPIALFSIAGALLGVQIALLLPGAALQFGFGVFLIISAAQLTRTRRQAAPEAELRTGMPRLALTGILAGMLSAVMGVGGGLVAVPLMLHLVGLDVKRVAATSLAVICFAAPAGAAAYMLRGALLPGLPAGSVGYVHVTAALPILAGAMIAVRWGAAVNRRMETRPLRFVFAGVLFILGLRLVLSSGWQLL